MEMVHFIPPAQRRLVMLAAQADSASVLIFGANGTGKGAIARWIHGSSPRSIKPFIEADQTRSLALQLSEAQEGTLVIDEIGSWPLAQQKILFEFLKTKSVPHPNQDGMRMLLNVRLMATASQNLEGRAQSGMFNEELLQALNVFRIEMPNLAKRKEEFKDIVLGILGEITRELNKQHLRDLSEKAWTELQEYEWPGNLRELRNVLRIAVVSAKGDHIVMDDLPEFGHANVDFRAKREEFEKTYITELLKASHYQVEQTAEVSRMDKDTLLQKIREYGIDLGGPKALK